MAPHSRAEPRAIVINGNVVHIQPLMTKSHARPFDPDSDSDSDADLNQFCARPRSGAARPRRSTWNEGAPAPLPAPVHVSAHLRLGSESGSISVSVSFLDTLYSSVSSWIV